MKIHRLVAGLSKAGKEVSWHELRDILWLAEHITAQSGDAMEPRGATQPPPVPNDAAVPAAASRADVRPSAQRLIQENAQQADPHALYGRVTRQVAGDVAAGLLRVRGVRPLLHPGAIGRALRPLSRKRTGNLLQVDEQATAEHIAETGRREVVYRSVRERWIDIVILAEQVPSMAAWSPVLREFERLLQRQGGFCGVRTLELKVRENRICAVRPDGVTLTEVGLVGRSGRRLLLIASDCTSAAWRDGRMGDWIRKLSPSVPVSIAQFLPRALWPNTAIGFAELHARSFSPAAPTRQLQIRRPSWAVGEAGIAVPVFSLTPGMIADWARMTASAGNAWSVAALVPLPDENLDPVALQANVDSRSRIERFRASVTPKAYELAAYFAQVKPLTPPVMRIIQNAMAPASDALALAQVFIGGLLYPVSDNPLQANPDDVAYEFYEGLRDIFAASLTTRQFVDIQLALHHYLQELSGTSFDFFALFAKMDGAERLPPEAQPFATFSRERAGRFGMVPATAPVRRPRRIARLAISMPMKDRLMFSYGGGNVILEMLPGRIEIVQQMLERTSRKPDISISKKMITLFAPPELVRELRLQEAEEHALCELVLPPSLAVYPWEIAFSDDASRFDMFATSLGFTRRIQLDVPSQSVAGHGGIVVALEGRKSVIGSGIYDLSDKADAIYSAMIPVTSEISKTVGMDPVTVAKWMEGQSFRFAHVVMRDEAELIERQDIRDEERANLTSLFAGASHIPEFIFFERSIGAHHVLELLKAGVRVIIEPVSLVSGAEALAFASTLYRGLGEGQCLIEAVKTARRDQAAADAKPGLRAFACYGNADWSLAGQGAADRDRETDPLLPIDPVQADDIAQDREPDPAAAWPFPVDTRGGRGQVRVKVFISEGDYAELAERLRHELDMPGLQLRFIKGLRGGKNLGVISPHNLETIRHSELVLCIVGRSVEYVSHHRMDAMPRTLAESVYEAAQKQRVPVEILVHESSAMDEQTGARGRLLDKKYVTPYGSTEQLIEQINARLWYLLERR